MPETATSLAIVSTAVVAESDEEEQALKKPERAIAQARAATAFLGVIFMSRR